MKCNLSKCKELIIRRNGFHTELERVQDIPQFSELTILGITFQENCRFSVHVKNTLIAANKCLYVLRILRKEGYSQLEIDKLFSALVMPKLVYGVSVYGASPPEITSIQCCLDRCHKRGYTSFPVSILNWLEKSDKRFFNKLSKDKDHPLFQSLPGINPARFRLRRVKPTLPYCITERFKNSFINRLSFNYNLAISN